MNKFAIIWKAWYGNEKLSLSYFSDWDVKIYDIRAQDTICDGKIKTAISRPIGIRPLSQLVRGKKRICIAVDDLTRPTEAYRLLPHILKEIKKGGMVDENIFFIISNGTHRALTKDDMVKKLSLSIYRKYNVYNHNCYQNNRYIGRTSFRSPIYINRLFLEADFKIGIGSICPHPYMGFSGGAKIVYPGLAGIKSIVTNHRPVNKKLSGTIGIIKDNTRREEAEEVVAKAGLNFIINTVSNARGRTAAVFAGHPLKAFREGVKSARKFYSTRLRYQNDIGVFNAFPRDNFFLLSLNALNIWSTRDERNALVKKDGSIVIINACSEGCGEHGLVGKGMSLHIRRDKHGTFKQILNNRRLFFFSKNINIYHIEDHYPRGVLLFDNWNNLLSELRKYHGKSSRVAVFPCGPLQIDSNFI